MSRLLFAAAWCVCLLPSLLCGNLLCFYRPLTEKEKAFQPTLTECPPNELCFTADGRYGNHSALSAQGCVAAGDCSRVLSTRFKGTAYATRYACCDWSYCNSCPGAAAASLSITVTLTTVALMGGDLWSF
ncbi:protein Bouncer [Betta splendens]|uniref:Protein Bouncer n=1 Tax=Betta splendens TaxID=158456 RepID=A0A6P7MSE0_BETSP|nr:protein Bouncer [Betta splendens]